MSLPEDKERLANLRDAEYKADQLFREIERDLIRPGITEKDLSQEIHELGAKRFAIKSHWHKRVVRTGENTLCPYSANPPNLVIQADDIMFVDLGPLFEEWEADFGRTFVLGDDPDKIKLRDALEPTWHAVRARFLSNTKMTGEQLYQIAVEEASKRGWKFGAQLAGHLIGNFPHERIPNDKISLYITKGNHQPMNALGADGHRRHWILEIYLHHPSRPIGGFFEQLLTDDDQYINSEPLSGKASSPSKSAPGYLFAFTAAILIVAVYIFGI
ncbi:hypothetical protein N7510_007994 [Penicillium lagena]|uniref:uncharacterized protein n=1 Tax=Penicillium lagena TaxID=94218 RepID=UPI002540962D|nr:uncharacterized protein N7510_007994 [Penicillium lagena]KAJ5611275.1 hypothetical protein N7510_007994 [Penicillium lagena]